MLFWIVYENDKIVQRKVILLYALRVCRKCQCFTPHTSYSDISPSKKNCCTALYIKHKSTSHQAVTTQATKLSKSMHFPFDSQLNRLLRHYFMVQSTVKHTSLAFCRQRKTNMFETKKIYTRTANFIWFIKCFHGLCM